jgi:DNA-binding CsgD family transcriptional regulator
MCAAESMIAATSLTTPPLPVRIAGACFAVVSAPAGFGKTSVVRESIEVAERSVSGQRPGTTTALSVVWPRLGSAFRTDAATVVTGLADVVRLLGATGEHPLDVDDPDRIGASAGAALAADFAAIDAPCTLVLDDLHLVPRPLQGEIAAILRHWFDDDRHLIVSTRDGLSALSVHWPVHEAAVIVQPRDLLLDREAVTRMLGTDTAATADRVTQRIGGWARGVEVFRRHLGADPVGGFERAEVVLQALIASEILPHVAADDLELLLTVSLGESVPTSVTERVSGGAGAAMRLRSLADETAFVVVDGDEVGLVPIFRQALMQRMTTGDPGAVAPSHLRIAQAFLDEPMTTESTVHAVHHLQQARSYERAVTVLQQRWGVLYTASRLEILVDLMERIPVRYWADDPGCALLVGWANLLIGRSTRALELIQSPPLRTPAGAAIKRLVWAQGVWWTTGPAEALQLVAEGRSRLDSLPAGEPFPRMPGNDDAPAFHIVADGAEIRARFLLGDLAGSVAGLDALIAQPSQLEPISVAGLHAVGALVRAFRGDRNEALKHLQTADSLVAQLSVIDHYVMQSADLARALLAALDGDVAAVAAPFERAVQGASDVGAANLHLVCELVADLAGVAFEPSNPELAQRAASLPFVASYLPVRAARRRADLGDSDGAATMLKGVPPNELAVSAWLHVLLLRHRPGDGRRWLAEQPAPSCAHGQVVRLLSEATVADSAAAATSHVRRAVAIASDRRLLGVICEAPAALWDRPEIARLDLPMLVDARRVLAAREAGEDGLRFTTREIELLRLLAGSATAAEIAGRLYLSVNTVKWHKANIYRKLGVSGSRVAVERAVELGLLDAADLP